jgi:transcriptional activator SPT8
MLHTLTSGHTQPVSCLSLCEDETAVLSGSWDKQILKWNLETGAIIRNFTLHKSQITSLDKHPSDHNIFLSSSYDGLVAIWDSRISGPVRSLDPTVWKIPPFCLSVCALFLTLLTLQACWSVDGRNIYCARRNECGTGPEFLLIIPCS